MNSGGGGGAWVYLRIAGPTRGERFQQEEVEPILSILIFKKAKL